MHMQARKLSLGLFTFVFLLSNLLISFGFAGEKAAAAETVELGDYITFGSYNGQPLKWQVIKIDANGYMLFAADSIGLKAFDANGDGTDGRSNDRRISGGSNFWEKSNLREWLNSSDDSVAYSHNPPSSSYVNSNPYDQEPGFLSDGNFTSHERELIQSVTHKTLIDPLDEPVKDGGTEAHVYRTISIPNAYQNYESAFYMNVEDHVFLLSVKELIDLHNLDAQDDGKDFPHTNPSNGYWLRDAMTHNSDNVRVFYQHDSIDHVNFSGAYYSDNVRPALYLKPGIVFTGAGTLASPYTLDASGAVQSSFEASTSTLPANGTMNAILTVVRKDAYGNPVEGQEITIDQGSGSSAISIISAVTNAAGQARFGVSSTKAETVTYTAIDEADGVVIDQTAQVTFTAGVPDASASTVEANTDTVEANGTAGATITVTVTDRFDNPIAGHSVNLTPNVGGSTITPANATTNAAGQASFAVKNGNVGSVIYTAKDTTSNVTIAQTVTVDFVPGSANAGTSTLTADAGSVVANGTSSSVVTATVKDANGHPIAGHTVSLSQGEGSSTVAPLSATTDASGQASFSVKSTKAETVTYMAKDETADLTLTQTAQVIFAAGAPDATASTVEASTDTVEANGTAEAAITVTVTDQFDNPISGHTVSLTPDVGESTIAPAAATTDASGKAVFTVTNTKVETVTYTAVDTTADNLALNTTVQISFTAGEADAALSTLIASKNKVTANGSSKSTLTVTIKDASGHPLAGHDISLSQGGGSSTISPLAAVTNANGEAVFTVVSRKAETVTYTATDVTDGVTVAQTAAVTFSAVPVVTKPVIDANGTELDPSSIDTKEPSVTVEVTPKDGTAYVSIPASVLSGFAGSNASFFIEIKTPYGSYRVPVDLAALIPGLKELLAAHQLTANDISFKIVLTDKTGEKAIQAAFAQGLPNGIVKGAIVDFSIQIIDSNSGQAIGAAESFTKALTRMIPMPKDMAAMPEHWGAFRYNEKTGKFEFAAASKAQIDGVWYAMIRSYSNSVYAVAENAVSFGDVAAHWGKPFIELAASKGLVEGVGGGKYAPSKTLTRAEFTSMLVRALGRGSAAGGEAPYSDVSSGAWYYGAVKTARELGLIAFASGNSFKPDQPITREEMASMLAGVIKLEKLPMTKEFVSLDHYNDIAQVNNAYLEDVRLMVKLNIMTGTSASTFDPQGVSTRAQAAVVYIRMLQALGFIDRGE